MSYYDKTIDKNAYQRYLNKNDDEYWNDYVNVRTGESVGNLEEALSEQERLDEYRITVSKTDDNRVNINMSRGDALRLMEDIGAAGNPFTLSGTLRSLLRTFFINNEDITSEDSYY